MPKTVALIHTSFVFFDREKLLFETFAEILPTVVLKNIVDDTMLSDVMQEGMISAGVIDRMKLLVQAAEAMGVDAIFNTCSSLGPAFEIAKELVSIPMVKIDDGMAEKAALEGKKIAVLATVPTTLKPTVDLIHDKAEKLGRHIETQGALSQGAFELLMNGKTTEHDEMVLQTAQVSAGWADTLVLAQCSMARLAPSLSERVGKPVLSSPSLGVERLKTVLG
jgi:Asp/Glu/hydantoin racemase